MKTLFLGYCQVFFDQDQVLQTRFGLPLFFLLKKIKNSVKCQIDAIYLKSILAQIWTKFRTRDFNKNLGESSNQCFRIVCHVNQTARLNMFNAWCCLGPVVLGITMVISSGVVDPLRSRNQTQSLKQDMCSSLLCYLTRPTIKKILLKTHVQDFKLGFSTYCLAFHDSEI